MRLNPWELAGALTFGLLGVTLLLGGDLVSGPVVLIVVGLWVSSRLRIVEQNVAGSYERWRWRLRITQTIVLLMIYLSVVGALLVASFHHWGNGNARSRIAVWALAGFAWLLYKEMDRRSDAAFNSLIGSRAEERVGRELEKLRERGWNVVHNVKKDFGGNVDHVVWGEHGAYAIETKNGRFRHRDIPQAVGNAVWVKSKFGARWVTAVLCVMEEPPSPPRQHGYAWVLGPDDLLPWLIARPPDRGGDAMPRPTGADFTTALSTGIIRPAQTGSDEDDDSRHPRFGRSHRPRGNPPP
jgi:hypothetical protein